MCNTILSKSTNSILAKQRARDLEIARLEKVLSYLKTKLSNLNTFDENSDIAEKLIISLGYGFSIGYFLIANLSRFESLNEMIRKVDASSVFLPAIISGVFSLFIWLGIHNESYGKDLHFYLSFGLILIFVIWQFAQAWWMRIPFKEFSLRRMDKYQDEGETKLGILLNLSLIHI